jgi:cystathionine beta-lyase
VGRVFLREELEAICAVVDRHGGRVFSDEIHAPLVYAGARHVPYASISDIAGRHAITATSASKAWNLPGLKCAQLILSNDADAALWEKIGQRPRHGASNLGVMANTVAYRAGRDWLQEVLAYVDGNRRELAACLAKHLPSVRYLIPEGTYIAWLDCRALGLGVPPAEFFREKAGVALTDGIDCGAPGEGFVRLIFATPRPILRRAVRQMAYALRAHQDEHIHARTGKGS